MTNKTPQIKTACFTGHRDLSGLPAYQVSEILKSLLQTMMENGTEAFLAGGALGFDTMAALAVLDLKKKYPHIRLELALPCRDQTKKWQLRDRILYDRILKKADSAVFLHDRYTSTCMHDRNRYLVDNSDICIALLEHSSGGTAYTVSYAMKKGKKVINIIDLID